MKKVILFLVVIAIIVFFVTRNSNKNMVDEVVGDEMSQETVSVDSENSEDVNEVIAAEGEGAVAGMSSGYEAYNADKLAFANEGNVVVFFRASWCPSCKALDEAIKADMKNIPENLLILDADYDTETKLKQKYGITTQHTLVQVDSEGNLIQKWSGGSTLESIVEKL